MKGPPILGRIEIVLADERPRFRPGDLLSGRYELLGFDPREIKAVELSVLWYTEGKGEEDLAVHFFERVESVSATNLHEPQLFGTRLPESPLSYAGLIVKIRWCVRVRAFLSGGKEVSAERPFQLGSVPPGSEVEG